MQKAYKYSILYFLLFALLLLGSSTLLFSQKIGFSYQGVLSYYLGDENLFMMAKSKCGLFKIILPHIFAFGLFIMVVLHILLFTKLNQTKHLNFLVYSTFFMGFLELFSPFFILGGFEFFAYIKLLSFFIFEILLLYIFWLLLQSIASK